MTEHKAVADLSRPVAVLERALLARAVAMAALPVDRKNPIPILSNLRLSGSGESLTVRGTDMDILVSVNVPGAADSRLDTTVPAKMLKEILAKAKDSDLASLDDSSTDDVTRCGLDLGGVKFNLNAISATDFPTWENIPTFSHTFDIPAAALVDMLSKVSFAVSTEETRYYLNGVYLHTVDRSGVIRAVATDGHRLAVMAIDAPEGSAGMPGAIVPRKAVSVLLDCIKTLGKGKAAVPDVTVAVGPAHIGFQIGPVNVTSKLVDGAFPDYERVIPRNGDAMVVNVKALDSAVEQVGLISDTRGRAVKLAVEPTRLTVSRDDADNGSAETSIPVTFVGDRSLDIGFNASYLRDVLAEMAGEGATFMLHDSGSPSLIFDPADARFMSVLMPMRT